MDYLTDTTGEEYGSGTELNTTGFLIFGLLTFWIYTVRSFFALLERHYSLRLAYFEQAMEQAEVPRQLLPAVDNIKAAGFKLKTTPRTIATACYLGSMVLILSLFQMNFVMAAGYVSEIWFDRYCLVAVGIAALLFSGADIYFLTWVCRTIKQHEYHELLFARLVHDPVTFRPGQPSGKFIRRWNRKQSQVALFIVISIPMTISPLLAVWHIQYLIYSLQPFLTMVIVWSAILFGFAGIFHLVGTHILITMFNDHLRIEALNHQQMIGAGKWSVPEDNSVVAVRPEAPENASDGPFSPQRALAAIMITDMVGFSKEMEDNEGTTYNKLLTHNEISRRVIDANRGTEIKTIGDAFLVRFNSAVDAVRSAIVIQGDMADYNADKADQDKIIIRIGVHIGDVLIMGQDVIGNGVNITARIEPLAETGGICISSDVYNLVKKSIDIQAVNLGKQELKNIKDAPEIYKLLLESIHGH